MSYEIDTIPLHAVRINGGTQSRVELSQTTIAEYAEAIRAAVELPPVITFFDGSAFWLADGFHRYNAHRDAGTMEINAEIRIGTHRDAILFSVGANASHGLRRTNEDKRRAVMTLLKDAEWGQWSDREISRQCGVGNKFVGDARASICVPNTDAGAPVARIVERNGKTYEQNTANIGKVKPVAELPPQADQLEQSPVTLPADGVAISPTHPGAAPAPVPFDEVRALREKLAEIAENMKSTLADNEMMGRVFDADDRIKAAMDEAIRQKAIAESAERTLASKSGEFIERARAVRHWMNRAQKAEKALAKLGAAK